ncbi:MAG: TIGR02281 family clan AA aspartic protease [Gammaproteobacteria bacterium]
MHTRRTLRAMLKPGSCSKLVMAVCVAVPPVANAEVYRWIDASGEVHYGDRAAAGTAPGSSVTALTVRAYTIKTNDLVATNAPDGNAPSTSSARIYDYPSSVRVNADETGVYRVDGSVNGRPVRFVVDTGANLVTLNRRQAEQLGLPLPPAGSETSTAQTASGTTGIHHVRVAEMQVGNVVVHDTLAAVTEDVNYPESPLLGMSFLSHAELVQSANVLEIRQP